MYKLNKKQIETLFIGANIHALSLNPHNNTYEILNFFQPDEIPSELSYYASNNYSYAYTNQYSGTNEVGWNNTNSSPVPFTLNESYQKTTFKSENSTVLTPLNNLIVHLKTSTFQEALSNFKDFIKTRAANNAWGDTLFTVNDSQTVKIGRYKNYDIEYEDSTIPLLNFDIDDSLVLVDDYIFYDDKSDVSSSNPRTINTNLYGIDKKMASGFGPFKVSEYTENSYANGIHTYPITDNIKNQSPTGLFINPFNRIIYSYRHALDDWGNFNDSKYIYAYNINSELGLYDRNVYRDNGILDYAMLEGYDLGCYFIAFDVNYAGGEPLENIKRVNFRVFDRNKLLRFISYFGMKATYSQKAALDLPSEDFPSFDVNPDDPINPGGKAEGYPDNQKIELNVPKSSPSGGNGSIYILNPTHLNYIRNGLWDEVVFQSFWGNGVNPFDFVVGLWWYPFSTYDLYGSQISYKRVKLGSSYIVNNDVPGVNDGATINLLDGGKLHVPIMTDSYLDYEPYTSYNLFIPYIGFQSLNSQDIVGKELSIKYFVNIYDGTLTAFLFADKNLINTYEGVVGVKIPMTNYDSRIQTLQFYTQGQQMLSRASQVISGGVGAASNFGVFGQEGNVLNAGSNIATNTLSNIFDANSNKANQALSAVNNNYGMPYGLPGIYAPQTAYLKIETSLAQIPTLRIGQEGKNASISGTISGLGLSGFVKTTSSTIITASGEEYITEEEKMEIDRIMKGGVVING